MSIDMSRVFDSAAERPSRLGVSREVWSMIFDHPAPPDAAGLFDGAGRPVLVLPGFLCGDIVTAGLRRFLDRCGFRSFGWGLGINWGPTPRLLAGLDRKAAALAAAHGPFALVGISLGGLLARNLAHDRPSEITRVVTLASPVRLPTASPFEPMVRMLSRRYDPAIDIDRLGRAPPAPTTSICTRDDGIVAPRSCLPHETEGEAIELDGAHLSFHRNPAARRALVRILAAE